MITRGVPDLHPDSSKFYFLKWNQSELGTGVTITNVAWTVPSGLAQDAVYESGLTVGVRLSVNGGIAGNDYDVACQITTSNLETLHEILRIRISTEGH